MRRITYSDDALDDLDDILNFTHERWGPQQASEYLAGILNSIENIGDFAEIGSLRRSVLGEVRRIRHESHYIVYGLREPSEIRILRVVHVRRALFEYVPEDYPGT